MSWQYAGMENVEGVRKVKWDGLWHVMYKWGKKDTWDRVSKKSAMYILKQIEKAHKNNYQ
jgi:hypothetical protein